MPTAKVQKAAPEGQGENWICKQCGNENWPLRTVCNKKECRAPGPWTCGSCGNKNFQGRMVCNRKSCGLPRPAAPGEMVMSMQPMGGGCMAMPPRMGMQQMGGWVQPMSVTNMQPMGVQAANLAGHPEGSWSCKECSNVNWPLRTVCKKCNALGPWTCPACGNKNFQGRAVCNRKTCGLPRPENASNQPAAGGKGGGPQSHPEGSWECPACGNVNWPMRTTCNKKECGQPKPV
eukprot:TRINITY_DN43330_c0_g1_i1.p1 TRINITY_DN43330_c0_g1~~TRINITY_DN43330_c0_g1_i1.p1  ORF type:complete len:260 (+),score=50.23 TRINITY_DN43330_c0_g1_i1:84-782(+)